MFWTRLPLLRGLIAFALLAIAFGHQPLNPGASGLQNAGADELSAYALPDGTLPEIFEIPSHPWFIGVQYHPELKSRPFQPHPLFASFIEAAVKQSRLV